MASKKSAIRTPATSSTNSSPLLNLSLVAGALIYGMSLLVSRGRVSWPPGDLLTCLYTVAGCMAMIGPIVLLRRDAESGGVGEMIWMTGGILIWIFDIAGLIRGEVRTLAWATPLGSRMMGMMILAVLMSAWLSSRSAARSWAWTNVTGWLLGILWVALGVASLVPGNPMRLAML